MGAALVLEISQQTFYKFYQRNMAYTREIILNEEKDALLKGHIFACYGIITSLTK